MAIDYVVIVLARSRASWKLYKKRATCKCHMLILRQSWTRNSRRHWYIILTDDRVSICTIKLFRNTMISAVSTVAIVSAGCLLVVNFSHNILLSHDVLHKVTWLARDRKLSEPYNTWSGSTKLKRMRSGSVGWTVNWVHCTRTTFCKAKQLWCWLANAGSGKKVIW